MMSEISSLTFSAGRVETNAKAGSRGRPVGLLCDDTGLASAKHNLRPPGHAEWAPQAPYWPRKFGCGVPAVAGAGGVAGFGAAVGAAGAAGFGAAVGAGLGFAAGACVAGADCWAAAGAFHASKAATPSR